MYPVEQHEMQLQAIHPSGAEEWHCPICGRRFLMRWSPYQKTILQPGDEQAWHTGNRSTTRVWSTARTAAPYEWHGDIDDRLDDRPANADDEAFADGLRPWLKWMRESGFDDRWNLSSL